MPSGDQIDTGRVLSGHRCVVWSTSLRMIAEQLNITKAALYYHYQSKEEILAAVLADFSAAVAEITDWGKQQPAGAETQRELLLRYAELTAGGITAAARFTQDNQPALRNRPLAAEVAARHDALRAFDRARRAVR